MITVKEYIEAILKNGLPKMEGDYFRIVDGEFVAACAVGQARINLGFFETNGTFNYTDKRLSLMMTALGDRVEDAAIRNNDGLGLSFEENARKLTELFSERLNDPMYISRES